jgi:hypothetical protein
MGGWGSGYRGPSARLVEQCAKIDLADLIKKHKTTLDEGEGVSMSGAFRLAATQACACATGRGSPECCGRPAARGRS